MIENPKEELEYLLHELDRAFEQIQDKMTYQRDAIAKNKLYRLTELQLHESQIQRMIGRIDILKRIVEGDRND